MTQDRDFGSLVTAIRQRGYWRVQIHPDDFRPSQAESLDRLSRAFESARVELRGWDYPHRPRSGVTRHQGFIQGTVDFGSYQEAWRLASTGLFVHEFAMWEDTRDEVYGEPFVCLDVTGVLYKLTEIFLFAGRLTQALMFESSVHVAFAVHHLQGRQLQTFDPRRHPLSPERRSAADLAPYRRNLTFPAATLIGAPAAIAVDEALALYSLFNWSPAREQVEQDQRKLLERRL